MKKIAILLATYNGSEYIKEQVDSILNQRDVLVTIFVSDDLSTDDTLEKCNKLYENDIRIIYLKNKEKFGGAARNFFRLIKDVDFNDFDYVSLADQDDIWYEDKLIRAINNIENKNIDAYSSNVIAFWDNGKRTLIDKSADEVEFDFLFGSAGPGCTIVIKKDIAQQFKKKIIQNESLIKKIDLHDWLLYAFVRSESFKWWVDPIPSMDYRQHGNNEFGANSGFKSLLSRWGKARNGWYKEQILLTSEFCELENTEIIKLLSYNSYFDRLSIIKSVFSLKKKKTEALFLALLLLVPGFK